MSLYLAFGLLAFLVGPIVYMALGRWTGARDVLDLVVTAVVTILALAIFWESIEAGGWISVVFGAAGFLGPLFAERMFADKEEGVHLATYLVGIAGLLLHAAVDGAVLLSGDAGRGDALAWAVVLHRLPAGLAVWWLARIGFGVRIAWLVLGLLALATIGGYEMAAKMLDLVSNDIFAWFQAFVAGSLLHLAFHRVRFGGHDHNHSHRH